MLRDAVGPDVEIMIDINMGWTADQAIIAGRAFQDYDPYWIEEPVLPGRSSPATSAAPRR